jgi:hypothetical protein
MRSLSPADWTILEYLSAEPQPVAGLVGPLPRGSLYRHLSHLRAVGLVVKSGRGYALTSTGLAQRADRAQGQAWEAMSQIYPSLREVPTPQHRALLELMLAAVVIRQYTDQAEHHAGFLLLGPTLAWKSSAGRFCCQAVGVDPGTHLIECGAEAGQSLWLRRGPSGDIVAQRVLIDAPVAIFDEYQLADRAVRRAIAPFLTGRRHIPVENGQVEIKAVSLLILNPGPGKTLAGRTGLSIPQLRRLIPCDVGAVELGDLALRGESAVAAARRAGPLTFRAPRGSCASFRGTLVRLLPRVLNPDVVGMVDIELLLGLATGLTAWLPEASAMRQALYDALLAYETVGWTRAGWVDAVRQFPSVATEDTTASAASDPRPGPVIADQRIALFPERQRSPRPEEALAVGTHDSMLPPFTLSDATKARLIWLSQVLGAPLDRAVNSLIDYFAAAQLDGFDCFDVEAIVRIRKQCETTDVSVADLRAFLEAQAVLGEHGLTTVDVGPALEMVEALADAGLTLEEAGAVAALMADLREAEVDPTLPAELQTTLVRYQALGFAPEVITRAAAVAERLRALGITPENVEERLQHVDRLAAALSAAGLPEDRRDRTLARMVEVGLTEADLADLRAKKEAIEDENQKLEADRAEYERSLSAVQDAVAEACQKESAVSQRVAALQKLLRQWGLTS